MRRGKKELYVLTNPIMPGLIKVGCTTTDVEDRVNSLSTAVPADFNIASRCQFPEEIEYKGLLELEKEAHRRLAEFGYAENREFFRTTPEHASDVLQQLQNEAITHIAQGLTPTGKARQVALVEVPREPTQRKKPPEHWHVWQEQNREDERVTVLVLQRRVILQDNSCAHFEAGNERVRVSHDEQSVAGEEDPSVFSHNPSL